MHPADPEAKLRAKRRRRSFLSQPNPLGTLRHWRHLSIPSELAVCVAHWSPVCSARKKKQDKERTTVFFVFLVRIAPRTALEQPAGNLQALRIDSHPPSTRRTMVEFIASLESVLQQGRIASASIAVAVTATLQAASFLRQLNTIQRLAACNDFQESFFYDVVHAETPKTALMKLCAFNFEHAGRLLKATDFHHII